MGLHSLRQFFYDSHFIMSSVDFQLWELYVYNVHAILAAALHLWFTCIREVF